MSLHGVARQTLQIVDDGGYTAPSGARVDLGAAIAGAVAGTVLYRPGDLAALMVRRAPGRSRAAITVTSDTTQAAARRLAADHGAVTVVNFASARNPGGGFLGGARAQEEDLCRCSALYPCLLTQPDYYAINRAETSLLYSDHIIHSPAVPFFRLDGRDLLERPFAASVITAPAPNAGQHLRRFPDDHAAIRATLERRAGYLLAVARDQGARCLVLGAWGCGAFGNQPEVVAEVLAGWLDDAQFADGFDHVEHAIWDRGDVGPNLRAFQARFAGRA